MNKQRFPLGIFLVCLAYLFSFGDYLQNSQKEFQDQKVEEVQLEENVNSNIADKHSVRSSPIKVVVESGRNLGSILKNHHVSEKIIHKVDEEINKTFPKFVLKAGQEIFLSGVSSENDSSFNKLVIRLDSESEIVVTINEHSEVQAILKKLKLIKSNQYISGALDTNFYSALKTKGVSPKIIKTAAVNLGYVINFQHEIKRGDKYQFLYEVYKDEQGNIIKYGNILYMAIEVKGKNRELFGFVRSAKNHEYFSNTGESVIRGFIQTPLDARRIRISSGFTLKGRMHPIKGYCRAHKGVDFAASPGTPVIAAADGVVVQAGYNGDYGNKVTIQHSSGYKTVYAHLQRIKVRKGERVKQRQLIGTVGTTGLSTGPHLHFELLSNNVHINPMLSKMMPSEKLSGNELNVFKRYVSAIRQELSSFSNNNENENSSIPA